MLHPGRRRGTLFHRGQLAQGESARFTRRKSLVQIQHCPPSPYSCAVTGTRDTSRSDAVIETRGGVTGRPDDETREAPPDDVVVRVATPADLAGIVAMVRKAFGHGLEARLV